MNTAYTLRNKDTKAYFTYEDEDGCASFHKECPYLTTKADAEETLKRLKDKDCNYEIHESRDTVVANLNLIDEEAQAYISQLEVVEVEWKRKENE